MWILVIEDEAGIVRVIEQDLREAGYTVDSAHDGCTGLAQAQAYDAIVLDLMLPGIDGWQVLHTLRSQPNSPPVLVLTARDAVDERVHGLDAGADDYLVKPFAISELVARLRVLLRRATASAPSILCCYNLVLDLNRRSVQRAGRTIELSPREFALLALLMRHAGHVLTRTQLAEQVWGVDFYTDSNIVDVYVGYVRRKIDLPNQPALIQTVRGAGYRMVGAPGDA